ncbi:MAG: ATP-dependent sacrificial sulfur transferase LarE [Tannerellaceae bacterium]|jgi:uncharacterized protein|nr:ATP-dependent sacrificial sulfur transferase LarE [Tannerellaceae bacterium]
MDNLTSILQDKRSCLEDWFGKRKGSIVAFSGGIDSALVLFLAGKIQGKSNAIGVISHSESLKTKDFEQAKAFCGQFDISLEVIKTREISDEQYNQNPQNRCFFCKQHLYRELQTVKEKYPLFDVLNGTNYDDLGDYRPGLQAAANYRVQSPLVDCNVTKEDIRLLARYFGLPNWNKPASPCLSSRIPYHQVITAEKLAQIERAEDILNMLGFKDVRVRHYGALARIEVPADELPRLHAISDTVTGQIKAAGFEQVWIDPEGLVSGKLNRTITNPLKTIP